MGRTMKKTVLVLLLLCLTAGLFTGMAAAEENETTLFDASDGAYLFILLPEDASDPETGAAHYLQNYLEEITGVKPDTISTLRAAPDGCVISLSLSPEIADRAKGSYRLRWGMDEAKTATEDPVFHIEAAEARGLYNGVYGFLRRICGVEIYSTHVRRVPQSPTVTAERPYWYDYTPTLEYADTDWISPHDLEFALANGLNGTYSPLEAVHGGKVNYLWFCHSLTNSIVPESEWYETHPEYYALQEDGNRTPTQLCLSNPDVIEQAKKDVRARAEEAYDPEAALNILSVTQDDNQSFCTCENCTAIAEQYGGQSGLMLWFVNQIAEDIGRDYPDLVVDTFAYQYTRQAPVGITARDNVCVRLCSIECCFSHPLNDPACEVNAKFMKDLEDWSKICSRLYVWDYVTNFAQTLCVFPNFDVLRSNIETFRANNVVGIYEEGAYYADPVGTEFYDLRAYMLSVLMRDEMTAEEEQAARQGFLEAYYGGGQSAAAIGEILDICSSGAGNEQGHLFIYSNAKYSIFGLTEEDVRRVNELWQIALTAAQDAGDADAVTRIENSRLSWRYFEACTGKGEFRGIIPGLPDVFEMRKLIADLTDAGITRYSEGMTMDQLHMSPFLSPADWNKSDIGTMLPGIICGGIAVLLGLAAALTALIGKHRLCALVLLILSAVAAPLGASSGQLFIQWDNLPLYGFVDTLMLLTVAGFCFVAAWAINGCRFPKGKKAVLTILLCLFVAAAPYELVVLIINTIIHHGLRPTYSITVSSFVQSGIVIVGSILTIIFIVRDRKRKGGSET